MQKSSHSNRPGTCSIQAARPRNGNLKYQPIGGSLILIKRVDSDRDYLLWAYAHNQLEVDSLIVIPSYRATIQQGQEGRVGSNAGNRSFGLFAFRDCQHKNHHCPSLNWNGGRASEGVVGLITQSNFACLSMEVFSR